MTQYKPPIKVFLYQNVKPTVSNISETFSKLVAPVLGWMIVLHIGALVNMLSQNLLATISESTIIQCEFWAHRWFHALPRLKMAFMRTNILQFPWSHLRSELFSLYDGKRLPQELSLLWSASFFNDSCGPKDGCLASHLHLHKDTSFPAQLRAWMHSSNRFLGDCEYDCR